MLPIKEWLTSINRTTANGRNIDYIVVHYVGAVSTAYNNASYFSTVDRQASAHYFVDESEIWRVVAEKDIAWHCGSSYGYYNDARNSNSIGIEMCCKYVNGYLDIIPAVEDATAELVRDLMARYNIPADRVVRHWDVTRKECPEPMVSSYARWLAFKSKLTGASTGGNRKATVWLYDINGTGAQDLIMRRDSSGAYTFEFVASGLYLDVEGADFRSGTLVQAYSKNGTPAQQWDVQALSGGSVLASSVTIKPFGHSNLSLDISGNSSATGSRVQIWSANGTRAQEFDLIDRGKAADGSQIVTIVHCNSNKAIDVKGGGSW